MDKFRHIPMVLFSAYLIKLLIVGASAQDAAISIGLMALCAFFEYKPAQKQIEQLNQELNEIKESHKDLEKRIDEARTSIVGIKMSNGVKTQVPGRGF